jgi:hypothetical protein
MTNFRYFFYTLRFHLNFRRCKHLPVVTPRGHYNKDRVLTADSHETTLFWKMQDEKTQADLCVSCDHIYKF